MRIWLTFNEIPWWLVFCNIVPPHTRREEATAKLVEKISTKKSISLRQDFFDPSPIRLSSSHRVWSNMDSQYTRAATMCQVQWSAVEVRSIFLIADPTDRPCSRPRPAAPAVVSAEQLLHRPRFSAEQTFTCWIFTTIHYVTVINDRR